MSRYLKFLFRRIAPLIRSSRRSWVRFLQRRDFRNRIVRRGFPWWVKILIVRFQQPRKQLQECEVWEGKQYVSAAAWNIRIMYVNICIGPSNNYVRRNVNHIENNGASSSLLRQKSHDSIDSSLYRSGEWANVLRRGQRRRSRRRASRH